MLVALPILGVALNLTSPRGEVWRHLADTILWELLSNTFWLLVGVGSLAGLMGTVSAWLVATRRFPGRDVFEWALVLPLAVPTYVIGFVFVALFEYAGPVPTFFRETLDIGWQFPERAVLRRRRARDEPGRVSVRLSARPDGVSRAGGEPHRGGSQPGLPAGSRIPESRIAIWRDRR